LSPPRALLLTAVPIVEPDGAGGTGGGGGTTEAALSAGFTMVGDFTLASSSGDTKASAGFGTEVSNRLKELELDPAR
jgi:hypothetical protein